MRIKLLLSFFFLIGSGGYLVSAQENIVPKDSVDFWKFIMLQKNIPGLGYSWKVEGSDIQNQVDSLESFEFVKTDTGYFSKVFEDFDLISMQESELIGKNLNSLLLFKFRNFKTTTVRNAIGIRFGEKGSQQKQRRKNHVTTTTEK